MPTIVTTCKMNTLLDYIVSALSLRVKPKSGLNLIPTPLTAKRILRIGDFTALSKPLCAVQCISWSADPTAGRRFEGNLRFAIHCLVTARDGDEQELLNFVTDVIRAVQQDETLGGMVVYTFPVEFTPNVDTTANTGYAQAAVTFESRYIWDADTP